MDKQQFLEEATNFAHSDVVSEVIDTLEANYIAVLKATSPEESAKREHLYRMTMAVNALREELKSIANGELVQAWNRRLRSTTREV